MLQIQKLRLTICLVLASLALIGMPAQAIRANPGVVGKAVVEYQVEYRHATETDNQWRVSVSWTKNFTYAKGNYDYLVGLNKYDVRMYKRTKKS